jgi:hypothetical protein
VSGVKGDSALLKRIRHARSGDSVTVLDISLGVNREPLRALLAVAFTSNTSAITSQGSFPCCLV